MGNLNVELSEALEGAVSKVKENELAAAVQKMMRVYRGKDIDPREQVLASEVDVVAYAAYRLPATFAAAFSAYEAASASIEGFAPTTQLDVGGGMGTALWAASSVWPSLTSSSVLEQSEPAIRLGKRLARRASLPAVKGAVWKRDRIGRDLPEGPSVDLATMSYVLGELTDQTQENVVRSLGRRAETVILIEPGTPEGYERILRARSLLLEQGKTVAAPCPHSLECPLVAGKDWCHFSVRLSRSGVQRRLKLASLNFEDEKYSYVAATSRPVEPVANRVLRHPQKRKGMVSLRLCQGSQGVEDLLVSKRQGETYRAARKTDWGDAWPPSGPGSD